MISKNIKVLEVLFYVFYRILIYPLKYQMLVFIWRESFYRLIYGVIEGNFLVNTIGNIYSYAPLDFKRFMRKIYAIWNLVVIVQFKLENMRVVLIRVQLPYYYYCKMTNNSIIAKS